MTLQSHRSLPLWVIMLLFAVATVSVPLLVRFRRQLPPRNLPELAERVKKAHPEWRVVPVSNSSRDLDSGFFVCVKPHPWEELSSLTNMSPEYRWQGVTLILRSTPNFKLCTDEWGERALPIGSFVLLGDTEVSRQIAHATR